jgi:PAS domain S-box-containing protein/putative nucleotidyltransferase with HDIG domain
MNDVSSELEPTELQLLRAEVANLQELVRAITSGDVDAVVVGAAGETQLYSSATADRPYRLIVEEMGEGAAMISASGLILYVNKRLAQLLDCQIEALVGTASSELVDAGQQPLLQHLLSLPPGENHSELFQLRRFDGSGLAVLATVSTLETPEGLLRCLILADLTAMHRAEQALVNSELSYRMLAMNAQDGILILEWGSGQITMANPYIGQVLGWAPEELLGKQLWEIGAFVDKQKAIDIYAELQTQGYVRYEDLPLQAADGSLKEVEFVSNVYLVGDQKVIQCNIRDISDRKQAERLAQQRQAELLQSMQEMVQSLVALSETRDPYTAGHQARVANLATAIATEMGLDDQQVEGIRITALIHDIGKFAIPAEILTKPTALKPQEYDLLRTHVQEGFDVIKQISFPWPVAEMLLHHHERLDGSGYPNQLKGEQISLGGRILAVADTVEAMATDRPYRFSLGLEAALACIEAGKGRLYDPRAVDACLLLFREKSHNLMAVAPLRPMASFAAPHLTPALVSSGTDVNSTGGKKKDPIADASGLTIEGTERP